MSAEKSWSMRMHVVSWASSAVGSVTSTGRREKTGLLSFMTALLHLVSPPISRLNPSPRTGVRMGEAIRPHRETATAQRVEENQGKFFCSSFFDICCRG